MSVDRNISLAIIREEIAACRELADRFHWEFSSIDEVRQEFSVTMKSPIDREEYILSVQYDNYKEWPLLLEFIHPTTKEKGGLGAYPKNDGDSFFHSKPCICNPCSRKSYKGYGDLHNNWNLDGWQKIPEVNTLTNLRSILYAIYARICDSEHYKGRMSGEKLAPPIA